MVLLHGLWMGAWAMRWLARRLERAGFDPCCFAYPTVRAAPAANADRLQRFIAALDAPRVHLVAHSLGGLVVLHLFARHPRQPPGRVVLLGSPARGSRVARRLRRLWGGLRLLGRSMEQGLDGAAPRWRGGRDLGVVAGRLPLGTGLLFGLPLPHDGVVAVDETRIDGETDRLQLARVHVGLLFSRQVAIAVAAFLRDGRFPRAPNDPT